MSDGIFPQMRAIDPEEVAFLHTGRAKGSSANLRTSNTVLCFVADTSYFCVRKNFTYICHSSSRVCGMVWVWVSMTQVKAGKVAGNFRDAEVAKKIRSAFDVFAAHFQNATPKLVLCPQHGTTAGLLMWANDADGGHPKITEQSPTTAVTVAKECGFEAVVLFACHTGAWIEKLPFDVTVPQTETADDVAFLKVVGFDVKIDVQCKYDVSPSFGWETMTASERYLMAGAPVREGPVASSINLSYVRVGVVRTNKEVCSKKKMFFLGKKANCEKRTLTHADKAHGRKHGARSAMYEKRKKEADARLSKRDFQRFSDAGETTHRDVLKAILRMEVGHHFTVMFVEETGPCAKRGCVVLRGREVDGRMWTEVQLRDEDHTRKFVDGDDEEEQEEECDPQAPRFKFLAGGQSTQLLDGPTPHLPARRGWTSNDRARPKGRYF